MSGLIGRLTLPIVGAFVALAFMATSQSQAAPIITIQFSEAEGLSVRSIPGGDAAGTGSTVFSLNGANFSGGEVTFAANPPFYATPPASYLVGGNGLVTFDTLVRSVSFFFVDAGAPEFIATAFDRRGNAIATATSNDATNLNDPNNFVTLEGSNRAIARVEITGGSVDNFTFQEVPEPAGLALLAMGLAALGFASRRRWARVA